MKTISRREILSNSVAGAGCLSIGAFHLGACGLGNPLAFQTFSVRERAAKDLLGTIRQVAGTGYQVVELCSFKGFAGDKLKGDFGPLADMKAADVRTILQDARDQ